MTESTTDLLIILLDLRSEYLCVGERTREHLRLVGEDATPFGEAHRRGLLDAGTDATLAPDGDVAPDAVLAALGRLADAHLAGLGRACAAMRAVGFEIADPETLWRYGLRDTGAERVLSLAA